MFKQGEISALENSGRLPASAYAGATMYTTLSPCDMCTGACIMYKDRLVVPEWCLVPQIQVWMGWNQNKQTHV